MVPHMKTTVEIPDSLFTELKRLAARRRTSMRALLEQALRDLLHPRAARPSFHLRKASFRGKGLQPDVSEGSWEVIREMIYEGRGG